ncbi:ABC transporter permease [Bosea vestrisii]|uniref:ABC transporter permease n=1 Tax=Bosea vestrisii TaxID=151416 RepID=UPI0024E03371|nr:ABC transporter permease [Bosea vestrisii]WID95118.1 ABC transporter permease [Bosea vestrisii]
MTRSPVLAGAIGTALLLLAWELAARYLWRDPGTLPSPSQALVAATKMLSLREFVEHLAISLWRILAGFALASLVGIALGVACGLSRGFSAAIRPVMDLLRPIPPLAWIPLAIIWFGLGEGSKIFVIFLGAVFPIFTASWRGVTLAPPLLVRAARTMNIGRLRMVGSVILPAALPDIASGLRIGFGLSFGILVAAELIAARSGLGYLVMQGRELGQLGITVFAIGVIGLVNLVADAAFALAIRRTVGRWSSI